MLRICLACAGAALGLLGSLSAMACDGSRNVCEKRFMELVRYRAQAIEAAFGELSAGLPEEIQIKFVVGRDSQYKVIADTDGYDPASGSLVFPRHVLRAKQPNPLRWATEYWPYYEDSRHRQEFPVIETVDNALWNAYMQQAARAHDVSWPHEDCGSVDMRKRLPCEMLLSGIAAHIKAMRGPIFNANRIDRIWPEDFSDFRERVWGRDDQDYIDVQRYGGIMLVRPLISEFGVPRVLAYVARTPFRIENDNLRVSAHRYQKRAREALVW